MMKKILAVLLVLLLVWGCSNGNSFETNEDEKSYKIGVLQLLTHESLDLAYNGFIDYFKDNGIELEEGKNLVYQNPQADQATLITMADSLVNDNLDLILAIATSPAQALKEANINTPIVGTAITDYVEAGIVDSNEVPGGYITGVSDNCDMTVQYNLIKEVIPSIKTVGIIYTSGETNSEIQANQMVEVCKKNNVATVVKTISDANDLETTLQTMVKNIDVLYIPTDNVIASAMNSVKIVSEEYKLPVMCGASSMIKDGGLISMGVDYYGLGYQTGRMALNILTKALEPKTTPIEFQTDVSVYYNSETMEKLGITLPDRILNDGIDVTKE